MTNPKVSVLMPVYNTEENYLKEAINSLLNQTFVDFELIICDDGSTNNVVQIVESYQDERICFVQNEKNLGISASRNKLMKLAKGKYVAWADSDDISMPSRLEKQVQFLDTHPNISVIGAWYKRTPDMLVPKLPKEVGLVDLLKWCAVAQPVTMYRKEDFDKYKLTYADSEFNVCEDLELWSRVLMSGLKIMNLQEALLEYRYHINNISHSKQELILKKTALVKSRIVSYLSGDLNIQKALLSMFDPSKQLMKRNICFLGVPFLQIRQKGKKKKFYLFGCLPFLKIQEKQSNA